MKILLSNPRGFCAGVVMAIRSLERALELFGAPVYVYHEIVHNTFVVETFRQQGAIFVDSLDEVPQGSHVLFSAHGISPEVRQQAQRKNLNSIDATCPLVAKVHSEAIRFAAQGYTVVLIGHAGHDETVGTLGEAPQSIRLVESVDDVDRLSVPDAEKVAYVTQTTLSVDDAQRIIGRLRQRFPHITGPAKQDICYATQNRQDAVKDLLPQVDVVVVVGSQNSSNSNRLAEIARDESVPAYLVDGAADLMLDWFEGHETVLLTAGASAPEIVVSDCIQWFRRQFQASVQEHTLLEENAQFALPRELRSEDDQPPPSGSLFNWSSPIA